MYLKGSRLSMTRRRKPVNFLRIILWMALIGVVLWVNFYVVPVTPPLFIPTPTATREPASFTNDAQALAAQGKYNQAIAAYKAAIQANPKNAGNYLALAQIQGYTGAYKDAAGSAENALLINPNNSMAHALRGWALAQQGEWLEAEASINRAIEMDKTNGIAYAYLAELYALQYQNGTDPLGKVEKAREASRTAQSLAPNALETHRARGLVLEITANYEEAAREFSAAVAINSNIADLHLALGRNYRFLQQYVKAVEEFNRANALNPTDPLPNTYISRTYATLGEFPKAIQYAQQAVKVAPTDPFLYGNLGSMYYSNKQYADAISPLRLAVRGGTNSDGQTIKGLPLEGGRVTEYYYRYGLAQAKIGECNEAIQISQIIIQGVPTDETAVFNAREIENICQSYVKGTPMPTRAPTAGAATPGTPSATPTKKP